MSWLSLTLVTDGRREPIDINFHWVISVRRSDVDELTMVRVNDGIVYLVEETPEAIWDAWVKLLQRTAPQRVAAPNYSKVGPSVVTRPSVAGETRRDRPYKMRNKPDRPYIEPPTDSGGTTS